MCRYSHNGVCKIMLRSSLSRFFTIMLDADSVVALFLIVVLATVWLIMHGEAFTEMLVAVLLGTVVSFTEVLVTEELVTA
jgi:hypothetical protein